MAKNYLQLYTRLAQTSIATRAHVLTAQALFNKRVQLTTVEANGIIKIMVQIAKRMKSKALTKANDKSAKNSEQFIELLDACDDFD